MVHRTTHRPDGGRFPKKGGMIFNGRTPGGVRQEIVFSRIHNRQWLLVIINTRTPPPRWSGRFGLRFRKKVYLPIERCESSTIKIHFHRYRVNHPERRAASVPITHWSSFFSHLGLPFGRGWFFTRGCPPCRKGRKGSPRGVASPPGLPLSCPPPGLRIRANLYL